MSITPFSARPLIEHLSGDAQSRTATLVYFGVAVAPATWWFLRWTYAAGRGLTDTQLTGAYIRRLTIKYRLTAGAFWATFVIALWNWRAGLIAAGLIAAGLIAAGLIAAGIVTMSYLVPTAKPAYKTE